MHSVTLQKRGDSWAVRWFSGTRRRSRQFATESAASCFRREKALELEGRTTPVSTSHSPTLEGLRLEIAEIRCGSSGRHLRARSVQAIDQGLRSLTAHTGNKTLEDVTGYDILRWSAGLRQSGISVATANKLRRSLRCAFGIAVSLGLLGKTPCGGMRQDRAALSDPRYLSAFDYAALVDACMDLRWRMLLQLCYTAGLRVSEALSLTWADVDFESGSVMVTPKSTTDRTWAWEPKDHDVRSIPIPEATVQALADLQASGGGETYVLVDASRAANLSSKGADELERAEPWPNLRRQWSAIRGRACSVRPACAGATLHDLRRACITNWSAKACPATVMQMAGHSSYETTRRYYAAVTEEQVSACRDASSEALSGACRIEPEECGSNPAD